MRTERIDSTGTEVVLVTQVFHPDPQSTSLLLSDLARALAERGLGVRILAGFPARGGDEAGTAAREQRWHGVQILRGGLRVDVKRGLVRRALGYLSYCLWLGGQLVFRTPRNARVLVVTNPPFAPILVYLCGWLRGWKFSVLLHDIYPDGLVALGTLSVHSWTARIWTRLNRQAFAAADTVITLGRDMRRLCEQRYAVPAARLAVIPNWSPIPAGGGGAPEESALWRKLNLRDEFVVQYSGNMGLWHDIDVIVEAAKLVRERRDIRFLLIGDGRRREAAEEQCRREGLANVTWLPFQPAERLEDSLSCCHVALISQRAELEGVAVPSKLYGILASARAVLAHVPPACEVAEVVREERCGVVVPAAERADALAAAIVELAADRPRVVEMGRRAGSAAVTRYGFGKAVDAFASVLQPGIAGRGNSNSG